MTSRIDNLEVEGESSVKTRGQGLLTGMSVGGFLAATLSKAGWEDIFYCYLHLAGLGFSVQSNIDID